MERVFGVKGSQVTELSESQDPKDYDAVFTINVEGDCTIDEFKTAMKKFLAAAQSELPHAIDRSPEAQEPADEQAEEESDDDADLSDDESEEKE